MVAAPAQPWKKMTYLLFSYNDEEKAIIHKMMDQIESQLTPGTNFISCTSLINIQWYRTSSQPYYKVMSSINHIISSFLQMWTCRILWLHILSLWKPFIIYNVRNKLANIIANFLRIIEFVSMWLWPLRANKTGFNFMILFQYS